MENVIRLLEGMAQDLRVASERLKILNREGVGEGRSLIRLDLVETPQEYIAVIDLPGTTKTQIDLNVSPNIFEVVAQFGAKRESGEYLIAERPYATDSRMVKLETAIRVDEVRAKFHDQAGVLRVVLPKEKKTSKKMKTPQKKITQAISG